MLGRVCSDSPLLGIFASDSSFRCLVQSILIRSGNGSVQGQARASLESALSVILPSRLGGTVGALLPFFL